MTRFEYILEIARQRRADMNRRQREREEREIQEMLARLPKEEQHESQN